MPNSYSISTLERKKKELDRLGKATGSLRKKNKKMTEKNKYSLVMVGAAGSGKSTVTIRFINGKFVEEYEPTLEDSYRKQIEVDSEAGLLDVYDTAGTEDFAFVRDAFMRDADGFVCVYSCTNRSSFDEVQKLVDHCKRVKDESKSTNIPFIILGNKCDLEDEQEVSPAEGEKLAKYLGASFYETSARTGKNINESFYQIIRRVKAVRSGFLTDSGSFRESESEESVEVVQLKKDIRTRKCTII